jgi:hypothetical protein
MGPTIALVAGLLLAGTGLLWRTVDRAAARRPDRVDGRPYGPVDVHQAAIPLFLYGGLALVAIGAVWALVG